MKILHILGYDEIKFNIPLVDMLSNKKLGWTDEFYFATNNTDLYEHISKYDNVIYFKKGISTFVNIIWKEYDLIVIQGWNQSVARASVLKMQAAKKIVWRFWGSDIFPFEQEKNLKSKILGYLLFPKLCRRISNFYAIGYGGVTDIKLVKERFHIDNNMNGFRLGFRYIEGAGKEYRNLYEYSKKETNLPYRIMIGHSANERENHLDTLERLRKFKDENIKIILVLSYGKEPYRRKVISKAKDIFGDKVEVYTEMMPISEYRRFLSDIDIFIIESMGSNALGNVSDLAYFGKKIYIRQNSFLDEYLNELEVEHFLVENIENMDFSVFSDKKYDFEKNHKIYLWKEDDESAVKDHKLLYDEYKERQKR